MRLKYLGERRVISRIRRTFDEKRADILLGIGDDAALVRGPGKLLLTTDILVEDEDFRAGDHPPRLLGRKALNINLSDIAAMGGRPLHALVGMAMPGHTDEGWLRQFMAGFRSAAREAGVVLVGGDLSQAEKIMIAVTVTGEATFPVKRGGARAGDAIYVSGTLGDAAGGLRLLEKGGIRGVVKPVRPLVEAFLDPSPRLKLGALLARRGFDPDAVRAAVDEVIAPVVAFTEAVPEAGSVPSVTVVGFSVPSASLSLASTFTVTGVVCGVAAESFTAVGASLTAATVTAIVTWPKAPP